MSSSSPCNKGEQSIISEDNSRKKWDCLKKWIHCICVVAFDLELGQAIEVYFLFISTLVLMNNYYFSFKPSKFTVSQNRYVLLDKYCLASVIKI